MGKVWCKRPDNPARAGIQYGRVMAHGQGDYTMDEVASVAEEMLVRRAVAGDGRAFADLVAPHVATAFRIAARATRSAALAEEAVQESMVILSRDLHLYQPGTSLRAYWFAMVARCAHTLARSELRRRRREEAAEPPASVAGPAANLARLNVASRLDAALQELPERRKLAAILRLDGELSYAEVAAALGTTEQAARQLVYEATRALRIALADLASGDDHVH